MGSAQPPWKTRHPVAIRRRLLLDAGVAYSLPHRALCPSRWRSLVCKMPMLLLGLSETNTIGYYNLLNWTAQEPVPPGVSLWDNGQIIPLATSLHIGVIGIRSHAAGALSPQVDRPVPPGDPPGARCGPCTHVGLPPGGAYPHLVAGGDGVLPDEPGHRYHRAWCEKCGGDGGTGGVCRPAPDSAAASHALTGTLRPWLPRVKHSTIGLGTPRSGLPRQHTPAWSLCYTPLCHPGDWVPQEI
jgi:hypothetical protein